MSNHGLVVALEARMGDGEPFTIKEISRLARNLAGQMSLPDGKDTRRIADAAIQRWRKRGWISFVRFGRETVWSLTDAGREALKKGEMAP